MTGVWFLINKQNSIPDDYTFQLGTIKGKMQCDKRILEDLLAMLEAAEEDGVNLTICSPYRDLEYQQMLFNRKDRALYEAWYVLYGGVSAVQSGGDRTGSQ